MIDPLLACDADVRGIWRLRRQREDWLAARGIDQWRPGETPLLTIREQVDRDEWHVVRDGDVMAALRILWADPEFWGNDDGPAVYVHGLMVASDRAGEGLGAELLDWAGRFGRRHGRTRLRLDSALTNPALTRYYERLGFIRQGRRQVGDLFEVILWERPC